MAAGYSKRTLQEKLGIKAGMKILIIHAPQGYDQTLGPLPEGVSSDKSLRRIVDFIQLFTMRRSDLETALPGVKEHLEQNGMLWISWPKGASKVKTDVNENVVRELALRNGLVDVKVCAVDDLWSGLKLVRRLKDRT